MKHPIDQLAWEVLDDREAAMDCGMDLPDYESGINSILPGVFAVRVFGEPLRIHFCKKKTMPSKLAKKLGVRAEEISQVMVSEICTHFFSKSNANSVLLVVQTKDKVLSGRFDEPLNVSLFFFNHKEMPEIRSNPEKLKGREGFQNAIYIRHAFFRDVRKYGRFGSKGRNITRQEFCRNRYDSDELKYNSC